jgi:hypothetical protein
LPPFLNRPDQSAEALAGRAGCPVGINLAPDASPEWTAHFGDLCVDQPESFPVCEGQIAVVKMAISVFTRPQVVAENFSMALLMCAGGESGRTRRGLGAHKTRDDNIAGPDMARLLTIVRKEDEEAFSRAKEPQTQLQRTHTRNSAGGTPPASEKSGHTPVMAVSRTSGAVGERGSPCSADLLSMSIPGRNGEY